MKLLLKSTLIRGLAITALVSLTSPTFAEEGDITKQGVDFDLVYKLETGRNLAGGIKVGNYALSNLDLRLAVDTQKLGAWENGNFFFFFLVNRGQNPSEFIGDRQLVSSIEASPDLARLYEAWYEHRFLQDKVSLLVGLRDLNVDFYVTDASTLFLNASFGIGHEFAQTGENGPSIFPVTAPGVRIRIAPIERLYLQAAAFNAVAGDPDHPTGTRFRLGAGDGALLVAEAAVMRSTERVEDEREVESARKLAIGAWMYTRSVDHQSETELDSNGNAVARKVTNRGAYALVNQRLNAFASSFLRAGFANEEANEVRHNVSAGFVFEGLIPGRSDDVFGVAVTQIGASEVFRQVNEAAGTPIDPQETTTEVTYRLQVVPGLVIQPSFQYIDSPDFARDVPYASNAMVRFELAL